jgi:hypothetical protein
MKRFPKAKRHFSITLKQGNLPNSKFASLFYARFALAHGFTAIQVTDFSERAIKGYSTLIKLQLAYSAFDTLMSVLDEYKKYVRLPSDPYKHSLKRTILANQFRSNPTLINLLERHTERKLKPRINLFNQGFSDDVLPIAMAIRHLTAHGIMSVGGGELELKTNRDKIDVLSKLLIDYSDEVFAKLSQRLDEYVENNLPKN